MAAFFGDMSFDQTGVQACLAPWVTRPLPAKKSTKFGREVFRSSFEQFLSEASILECLLGDLRGYFLQFRLGCLRKDRDGWQTASTAIGDLVRAARNLLGLSQGNLAKRLRVTEGTIAAWEAKCNQPSARAMCRLTDFLERVEKIRISSALCA